jgi:hypothetical protein
MKTTKQHFELFKKHFKETQKHLEMSEWEVYFKWSDLNESYARINTKAIDHVATVEFCKDWYNENDIYPLTPEHIKYKAEHEAIHMLTAKLNIMAEARFVTQDEVDEAEHELVRKIHQLL